MTAADAAAPSFNDTLSRKLAEKFPGAEVKLTRHAKHLDEDCLEVKSSSLLEVTREVNKHYPFLMDVCGVDYPERAERFDVVYHFAAPEDKRRLRIKTKVADGGAVPSVTSAQPAPVSTCHCTVSVGLPVAAAVKVAV